MQHVLATKCKNIVVTCDNHQGERINAPHTPEHILKMNCSSQLKHLLQQPASWSTQFLKTGKI